MNSEFTTKFISEAGSKSANKDYFGFVELDNFACWAVAETYDNDEDTVSAQLAVDTVLDLFAKKPTLSKRKLKAYIREAHRQLKEQSGKYQLKASIMIVASNYKSMRYAHCGNCRLHVFRGDNIFAKSHDQSLYQDMVDEGAVPNDDEHGIEESRNLFNYLGKQGHIQVAASKKIMLYDEDILLLMTWGFWEKISTLEMLDALEGIQDPMGYLDELQDLFLSKQERHVNNYTMAAVFANKTFQEKDNTKKIIKIALAIAIPLLITGIVLSIYFYRANEKRIEHIASVAQYEKQGDIYIEDENYDRALIEYDSGIEESKELKETKGKKGEENKKIKDLLTTKQRVTQLIIDGDSLFNNHKYPDAKICYEKALKEAKYDMDFYELLDTKELEDKLILCDDYQYTSDLIALADYQSELEQNEQALANYEEAKKLAVKNKNKEAEKEIKLKVETIKSQIKADEAAKTASENEQEQKDIDAKVKVVDKTELEADQALTDGNLAGAMDIYNKAISDYVGLNQIEKAAAVQKKVDGVKEKMKQEEDLVQAGIADGYLQTADNYILENKYDDAIANYKLAKDIYTSLAMKDEIKAINEKISLATTGKKELEVSYKILEISLIESEGDKLLIQKDYTGAKEIYKQAQTLYQGLNQVNKVLAVQDKIKGIDDIENMYIAADEKSKEQAKAEAADKERERIIYGGMLLEIYAEKALEKSNYKLALDYYKQAKDIYQSVNAYDEALKTQQKILEVEEKWPW